MSEIEVGGGGQAWDLSFVSHIFLTNFYAVFILTLESGKILILSPTATLGC